MSNVYGKNSREYGMRRWLKQIGWTATAFVAVVAIALAVWEPLTARAPVAVAYTPTDLRIARDRWGIPHVFGRTDADVAYGVAYAHAEDDFSTLQDVLAMTRGRLGVLTGADGARTDYVAQLLNARATVARDWPGMDADVRALFIAYAAGLNRYAELHPDEVKLRNLFPIIAEDVVAGFVIRSPFFFGLDAVLGRLASNEPLSQEGGPPIPGFGRWPAIVSASDAPSSQRFAGSLLGSGDGQNGSNAFAVAPARTGDGSTLLVSNSHQPWTGGAAWYELVVHSEQGWDFAGATFPGSPYPFLGHNRDLGWTNTVNRPDLIDVYRLTLNEEGTHYRYDGAWRPLQRRRVWLRIGWGPLVIPYPQWVERSVHGPVIRNDEGVFAIRYAGIDQLGMVEQYYRIQKARNFAEWRTAMSGQGVPATNFIYADREGNIGLFYNAMFPDRPAGYDWRTILPGDRSAALWRRTLPFDRVPQLINPASGYIMNANNTPFSAAGPGDELEQAAFDPRLGIELDRTNRDERAIALLEAPGPINEARLERIKYDTGYARTGYAGTFIARVLGARFGDPQLRQAQAILSRWDWTLDGRGQGDALALTVLRPANRAHYLRTGEEVDVEEILSEAARHLQSAFGSLDPPLGTVLRLRRGEGSAMVDLPLDGGNDTLRASTLWDVDDDGRYRVRHGDSFLMFIRWDRDGRVRSRAVQPFGAATTRPRSRHYADQAELFVAHQVRRVLFEPADLFVTEPRIYRVP
jgi:acyl-homoserine-lactone acylase